nr:DNA repair protein RAD16-like [Ipomoea batatas]
MKRRYKRSRPRKKAEKGAQRVEFSDDDNHFVVSSDSDYHTSEDDDIIDISEENEMGGFPFNHLLNDEVGVSDDDLLYKVPKRRRKVGSTRRGIEMNTGFKEEKPQNEEVVDGSKFGVGGPHTTSPDFIALINRINERKKKRIKKRKDRPILMWEVWDDENDQWLVENFTTDVEIDNRNEVMSETAEAPSELIMPLLRYQKEWLAWALKQEESASKGGILADEMGMGKTVQAIALVLAKRELKRAIGEHCLPSSSPSTSQGLPAMKGTLVICPVVAVGQWVSEIERFTLKGSNKVLVYHGKNREKCLDRLSEYDFVITTYSIVEFDYRKYVMPPKQRCEWCGKALYEKKMAQHRKYYCGPDATRTAKQSKQQKKKPKYGVKLSMEKTESNEGKAQQNNGSEGNPKKKGRKKGVKSYTIDNECSNDGPFENIANEEQVISGKSILHSVKWDRIILDEVSFVLSLSSHCVSIMQAHYIKERRSNTTKAILALESSYKWALSGTPLQNRVGELYSLVRFLQIIPYSYYFCKDCDCRALDYCSSTECPHCPHKSVRHFCWWNRYIASPIQAEGHYGNGRDAMILLKNKILKSVLLRRTKKGRAADLALPPRIVTLRRDSLDVKEEDYYTSLYNESQAQFNTYVREGTVSNNYAHIFDLLTRLRQAVDHPYLVEYSASALARSENAVDASNVGQPCGICHDSVEEPVVTSCAHTFCRTCLEEFSSSMAKVSCPTCSKPLTTGLLNGSGNRDSKNRTTIKGFRASSILNRIVLDEFQTSTKIDALREEIRFMVERDGSAKGIVFSQFTEFLDLIHYSLIKSGVNCVMLMGSMTMAARESAITKFTEDPECRIFLMSLKAGGVALNLTVASHVFLMDPWWNPAVERQAQDRIHRIGQYKPIRIVRFVIDNTIEERILKLQEKKELVFEGTIGGCSDALGKLTEGDLKFLFVT